MAGENADLSIACARGDEAHFTGEYRLLRTDNVQLHGLGHIIRLRRLQLFCLLDGFVDGTDHVERLLWQVVVVPIDDALEPTDGFIERHEFTWRASEDFRHEEGLGQEALDLPSPRHS